MGRYAYVLLVLVLIGCQPEEKKVVLTLKGKQAVLIQKVRELQGLREKDDADMNQVIRLHEEVRQLIEGMSHTNDFEDLVLDARDTINGLSQRVSKDGNFMVVSWDTGLDFMGNPIKTIMLYKNKGKLGSSSPMGPSFLCTSIEEVKSDRDNILYVLHGQIFSVLDDKVSDIVTAYTISNGYLEKVPLPALSSKI